MLFYLTNFCIQLICHCSRIHRSWKHATAVKEDYCRIIMTAWLRLSEDVIAKSFMSCALNLAVDGSEDPMIHCLKKDQSCEAESEQLQAQLSVFNEPITQTLSRLLLTRTSKRPTMPWLIQMTMKTSILNHRLCISADEISPAYSQTRFLSYSSSCYC